MATPARLRFARAVSVIAATIALAESSSAAQQDAFVGAVRELAQSVTPTTGNAARESRGRAIDRMSAALAEWDRRILERESSVGRELRDAPAQRAFQLHVELGLAYSQRGRLAEALREFDAAAASQPAASDVHVLRGLTLEAAKKPDDAGAAFRRAWELDPGNPIKAYYVLSHATAPDLQRVRQTLTAGYQRMLSEQPAPRGTPFLTLGAITDSLSRTPIVADAALSEAFALLATGAYTEAVAALRRSTPATGDSPLALFTNAGKLEAAGQVPEARRAYEAAVTGTLAGRSLLYVGIGRLAQVDGDSPGAITAFQRAVRLNPNDPVLRRELALALAADGRRDDAFAELVAALLIDPGDALAQAAIGQLYLDGGRYADAAAALKRALQLAPDRFETHYALATALTHLGETHAAAAELDRFERARRQKVEQQRRELDAAVAQEEAIRQQSGDRGGVR